MSHSYCSNRIHLVFSTKNRKKTLSPEIQEKLWPYMAGIVRNQHELERALEGRFEFWSQFGGNRRIEIAPGFHTSTTPISKPPILPS